MNLRSFAEFCFGARRKEGATSFREAIVSCEQHPRGASEANPQGSDLDSRPHLKSQNDQLLWGNKLEAVLGTPFSSENISTRDQT